MNGTGLAIPLGYGGYAATPAGQAVYMNYGNNPFRFLAQRQQAMMPGGPLDPMQAVPDVAGQGGIAGYATGGDLSSLPPAG